MLRKLLSIAFAVALPVAAQDTRTVSEPVFPPVCAVLPAQMAIVANGPASETTPDTARIQAALTACGAGNAVELAGSGANYAFLSAPLNVPSGVSLIVDGGVTLFASRNREDYQTAPISSSTDECGTDGTNGNGCKNFLLFNNNSTNANSGLYGYGVIDGRGYATTFKGGVNTGVSWWLNADSYTSGQSQNNPILMKLSKSTNFTLYKITLRNSPEFHVGWSGTGFTAWGVKIQAPWTAHNTDGIDPVGSNVTITNSSISNGDDQIAVGASSASSNITIQNSTLYSGHGLSVGSYTQGGLTNMLVQNVNMAGQPGDGNEDGIRLKSAPDRGGTLKNLSYNNICMRDIRRALYLTPVYNTNSGSLIPQFTNIAFNNIHVLAPTATYANIFSMQGYDANHISTVTLNNVVFDSLTASNVTPATTNTAFTLAGNVYPAFLQSLTGSGVTYTGSATATATPVYDCTAPTIFPYEVGELYLSTAAATNLQTAAITSSGSVTLNAMLQPAKSTQSYTGTAGSYTGVPFMTQPVQFREGATTVGSATLAANGTLASLPLTGVAAGAHTYTAYYPGDANYGALTFGSVTVNVTQAALAATTTTLSYTSPLQGVPTYSFPLIFSASVATNTGTPSGSIAFLDGNTTLATVPLTGTSASTTQYLNPGSHSITAVYLGDTAYSTSTSAALALTVAKYPVVFSTTTYTAAPANVVYGQTTVLTLTILTPTNGATPTGTVTFTDNAGNIVATGALDNTGKFAATTSPTTLGQQNYGAVYSGDANYSSPYPIGVSITVKATSATTLTANGGTYGTLTTLTTSTAVTSSPAPAAGPSGVISFIDTGQPPNRIVNTATNTSTQALYATGTHIVTASYPGDSNFYSSSSAPVTFVITPATASFTLTSSATTIALGGSVSLRAALTRVSNGMLPSGTITFFDGTTMVGGGTLNITSTSININITPTTAGTHNLTAVYSGDGNYTALTSAVLAVTVTGPPTFTLAVAPSAVTLGPGAGTTTPVATVTPIAGFVGSVNFTCTSPVAYISCNVVSPTAVVTTSAPVSSNLSIGVAATVAAAEPAPFTLPRSTWLATLLPLAFFGSKRRKSLLRLTLVLTFAAFAITGCGSSSPAATSGPKLPPAGTQSLTVTATSGTTAMSTSIAVTVTN